MKIYVMSDTHIGCKRYNLPEITEDINNVFSQHINNAIESDVDVVLHCGDLFDMAYIHPSYISFVAEQIDKLKANNIQLVLIYGNHDVSGFRYDKSPIKILEYFDNVIVLKSGSYQYKDVNFIGLSYVNIKHSEFDSFEELFDREVISRINSDILNIGMFHQETYDVSYKVSEYDTINPNLLEALTYSFIGHIHECNEFKKYMFTGSTYALGFDQNGTKFGYLFSLDNDVKLVQKIASKPAYTLHYLQYTDSDYELLEESISKLDETSIVKVKVTITNGSIQNLVRKYLREIQKKYSTQVHKLFITYDIQTEQMVKESISSVVNRNASMLDFCETDEQKRFVDFYEQIEVKNNISQNKALDMVTQSIQKFVKQEVSNE